MHFWIGQHRGPHQGHLHNYLPSTYDTGLTSPPRHNGGPPIHQDSVNLGAPPTHDPAIIGSTGVLKWAAWATIAFVAVFFTGSEFYKYNKGSNYQYMGWVLGSLGVVFLLLIICGFSRCRSKMRQDRPVPHSLESTACV